MHLLLILYYNQTIMFMIDLECVGLTRNSESEKEIKK